MQEQSSISGLGAFLYGRVTFFTSINPFETIWWKRTSHQAQKLVYKHLNADSCQYPRLCVNDRFPACGLYCGRVPINISVAMELHSETQSENMGCCKWSCPRWLTSGRSGDAGCFISIASNYTLDAKFLKSSGTLVRSEFTTWLVKKVSKQRRVCNMLQLGPWS